MIYAGIGSRETPEPFCNIMSDVAYCLAKRGLTLRSGNARGADYAFYSGANRAGGKMEIYLPEPNFGVVKGQDPEVFISDIPKKAFEIAQEYHPAWTRLSAYAKKLMARNVLQVLGRDVETPTNFIICYTNNGKASGGTGQAIRIAQDYNIPVFNLKNKEDFGIIKPLAICGG